MEGLIERDLKHVWHPCSQMKDFETCAPFIVYEASGSILQTNKGPLIDAISSWWCKSLGHRHPEIMAAIKEQLEQFEHVIGANTTHKKMVDFSEKLAQITGNQHVFFASDGSCAVEIALKLALHAWRLKNKPHKNQFFSLSNSYHGETIATLSVSDVGMYKAPFNGYGLNCHFIKNIPYVIGEEDPMWSDCDVIWENIKSQLDQHKDSVCALVVEPLIQGAGGMKVYSQHFLKKLAIYCKENEIFLISDEIMTGLCRTGKWLSADHAGVQADMICLSKGLTSGTVPISCVSITHDIYKLFYDDYETGKAFLHSHTYSGNALGVSAALATLHIMEKDDICSKANTMGLLLQKHMSHIANQTNKLTNIRGLGGMVAADLTDCGNQRMGYKIYQEALNQGAFLRPLGNTLYWFPPLNSDEQTISNLAKITLQSIESAYS